MMKTFCFKLYKSKKNKNLHKLINSACHIYNHGIKLRNNRYDETKKTFKSSELKKRLKEVDLKLDLGEYSEIISEAIVEDVVTRLDTAYRAFFHNLDNKKKNKKRWKHYTRPSEKNEEKYKSLTLYSNDYTLLEGNKICIFGKKYSYFKSREIGGKIKSITIKRDAISDIYIYFICDVEQPPKEEARSGKIVGFDFGIKKFLTASDGHDIEYPYFYEANKEMLKQARSKLARKHKGSSHYKEVQRQLDKLKIHICNQRKDFYFKLARKLCKEYSIICCEELDVKGIYKKYTNKMKDIALASFGNILDYEAQIFGTVIVKAPQKFASTKTCSVCGKKNNNLKLSDREWTCCFCNVHHDRDFNAAINILREGLGFEVKKKVK